MLDGRFQAIARYNEITPIESLLDLAKLNLQWYEYSKDRFEGWTGLNMHWKRVIDDLKLRTY